MKFALISAILAAGVLAAGAAQASPELAKEAGCAKCHLMDKTKKGAPGFQETAAKYKGKADAEAAVIKSITTGPTVKLDDGTQEEHTIIKTKDAAQLKNLAQWILSH
jgi:cytochrome c